MRRILLSGVALSILFAGAPPPAQARNNGVGIGIGVVGALGVLGALAAQAQANQAAAQQQQLQQQQQQQYYLQQQQAAQAQQQIAQERQREAAEAQERVQQRQQAEIDAKARQHAAEVKAAAKVQADAIALAKQQQAVQEAQTRQMQAADAKAIAEAAALAAKLRADPAFTAVVGPDSRDITVLVVGQDTANVVRNLNGDPTFQNGANACLPFGGITADQNSIQWRFLMDVQKQVEHKGGLANASLVLTECEPVDFAKADLIVFSHDQLANGPAGVLGPLLDLIRSHNFVVFGTYTIAGFQAAEDAKASAERDEQVHQKAVREAALTSFQTRDPAVVSAIHLDKPSAIVCVLSSGDPDGLSYLIKRPKSPFAGLVTPATVIRQFSSPNDIFIAMKRRDCLAAVAPAGVLKTVMAALVRDGVAIEVEGGTISDEELAGWKVLASTEMASVQAQQEKDTTAERRREAEQAATNQEQQALAKQHAMNDEASRREKLEAQRKVIVSKATAVVDGFAKRLQRHMDSVATEVRDTQQRAKLGTVLSGSEQAAQQVKYSGERIDWAPWPAKFASTVKDGWEYGPIQATLEDYGQAQWHKRTIEAISVKVNFPRINKVIGEKDTSCYVFTWIDDQEFSFMRQTAVSTCDDYAAAFTDWTQANGFVSQWKLLPVAQ
jgi:flagellar biosynthesis GTPase FlhF